MLRKSQSICLWRWFAFQTFGPDYNLKWDMEVCECQNLGLKLSDGETGGFPALASSPLGPCAHPDSLTSNLEAFSLLNSQGSFFTFLFVGPETQNCHSNEIQERGNGTHIWTLRIDGRNEIKNTLWCVFLPSNFSSNIKTEASAPRGISRVFIKEENCSNYLF